MTKCPEYREPISFWSTSGEQYAAEAASFR
jgi:hypothetical protein